jgi:hypothetical protein
MFDKNLYNKEYYQKNKTKLFRSVICAICGKKYTHHNKATHYKSNYHIKISEQIKNLSTIRL